MPYSFKIMLTSSSKHGELRGVQRCNYTLLLAVPDRSPYLEFLGLLSAGSARSLYLEFLGLLLAGSARSLYLEFLGLLLAGPAGLPGYLPPLMAPAAAWRQEPEGRQPGGRR